MRQPETRYARSGDLRIAYQVTGQGSLDLVFVPGLLSNLEVQWEEPGYAHLMRRLARFSRLIHFDKRGTGLSDRVDPANLPTLEMRADDVRAVMQASGSGRAALLGASEGAPLAMLFAATYPDRVRALVLYGGYASFRRIGARPGGDRALRRRGGAELGHRGDAQAFRARPGQRPAFQRLVGAAGAAVGEPDRGDRAGADECRDRHPRDSRLDPGADAGDPPARRRAGRSGGRALPGAADPGRAPGGAAGARPPALDRRHRRRRRCDRGVPHRHADARRAATGCSRRCWRRGRRRRSRGAAAWRSATGWRAWRVSGPPWARSRGVTAAELLRGMPRAG